MFEKNLLTFLKGIKKQCTKHYPVCDECPFGTSNYYDCEVRDFIHNLDKNPQEWDEAMMEKKLK